MWNPVTIKVKAKSKPHGYLNRKVFVSFIVHQFSWEGDTFLNIFVAGIDVYY